MIIDVHTHIFPPEMVENRAPFLKGETAFASIYTDPKAPMVTAEGLIAAMDRDGVDVSWAVGFPWEREENARIHNDYLARAARESGGRLRSLGCTSPGLPWALREAERALGLGLHGLGELAFYSTDLDVPALDEICRLAAEADRPVLLHTNEPVGHQYPGKAPMTLAALYKLVKNNPGTKLVLAHMAGGLFFYGLMKKEVSAVLNNVWIDTAAAPFLFKPRAYALAAEILGPDKVLMGTDYPLLPFTRYRRELGEAGLTPGDLELVLGEAARRLIP